MTMVRTNVCRALVLSALALPGCAADPPPVAPTPSPPTDEAAARTAVGVALTSLSKRNFDVSACNPADSRIAPEAEVRAGAPVGDHCTMLVARRADRSWLVAVRPATTSTPSLAGGALALVSVTPGGEGVAHIDYAH